jgi:hypothetical protein
MTPKLRTVEQRLAVIAAANHGVITRVQMLDAGVTDDEIKWRAREGSLIRVHRGVYRVGHAAPNVDARYMAAVRACGDGAALAGLAGAWFHRLIKGLPPTPEVTAPTERRVAGVITHRSRNIRAITVRRIPVTTVPHTLIAISSRLTGDELARACHEARVLYGTKPQHIPRPWPRKLRLVLLGDTRVTLSELEREFLRLLREHGLPLPQTNIDVDGRYVDCRWPEYKLTVELDGYAAHDSRYAWRQDHRRAREAYRRDDDFRRYIYEDVFVDPGDMLRELGGLLRRYPVPASARSSAG